MMILFGIISAIFMILGVILIYRENQKIQYQIEVDYKNLPSELKTWWKNRNQSLEEKYAKEIADGKIKLVYADNYKPSSLNTIGRLCCVIVFAVGYFWCRQYVQNLAENCQSLFEFNPLVVRTVIISVGFLVFCFIGLIIGIKKYLKIKSLQGQFYPSVDSKPKQGVNICRLVDEKTIKDEKSQLIQFILFFALLPCIFISDISYQDLNQQFEESCVVSIKS